MKDIFDIIDEEYKKLEEHKFDFNTGKLIEVLKNIFNEGTARLVKLENFRPIDAREFLQYDHPLLREFSFDEISMSEDFSMIEVVHHTFFFPYYLAATYSGFDNDLIDQLESARPKEKFHGKSLHDKVIDIFYECLKLNENLPKGLELWVKLK